MKLGLAALALAAALFGAVALAPSRTEAQPAPGATFACNPLGTTIPLVCTITNFTVVNGVLQAVGTVTNPATGATIPFQVPVQNITGSCQILHLVLGPINLNLLGLQVTTNQIVLDITAQSGPGNLLGNLLCAVAGLLNQGGPVQGLAGLLNNILRGL